VAGCAELVPLAAAHHAPPPPHHHHHHHPPLPPDRDEIRFASSPIVYRVVRDRASPVRGPPGSASVGPAAVAPAPAPAAHTPAPPSNPVPGPAAPPSPADLPPSRPLDDDDDDSGSDFEADDGADQLGAVAGVGGGRAGAGGPTVPSSFGKAKAVGVKAMVLHASYSRPVPGLPVRAAEDEPAGSGVPKRRRVGPGHDDGDVDPLASGGGVGVAGGGGSGSAAASLGDGPAGAGSGASGADKGEEEGSDGGSGSESDGSGLGRRPKTTFVDLAREMEVPLSHEVVLKGHSKVDWCTRSPLNSACFCRWCPAEPRVAGGACCEG
jgi:hypothetical protein